MSANALSRITGIPYDLGDNVLTVGAGGQFRYVDEALQYAKDKTEMVSIKADMDGTIAVTQYSDIITLSGHTKGFDGGNGALPPFNWASDAFHGAGLTAEKADARDIWIEIDGDGIYRLVEDFTSATSATLMAGYDKATGVGKSWNIYIMPRYILLLLPGAQRMSRDAGTFDCGDILSVSILGLGLEVSAYESLWSNHQIKMPKAGLFELTDMSIHWAGAGVKFANQTSGPAGDAQAVGLRFALRNIIAKDGGPAAVTDLINVKCADATISGVQIAGGSDILIVQSDKLNATDLKVLSTSGSAATENTCSFRTDDFQRTKLWSVTNLTADFASGVSVNFKIQGADGIANKELSIKDLVSSDGGSVLVRGGDLIARFFDGVFDTIVSDAATVTYDNCRKKTSTAALYVGPTESRLTGGTINGT